MNDSLYAISPTAEAQNSLSLFFLLKTKAGVENCCTNRRPFDLEHNQSFDTFCFLRRVSHDDNTLDLPLLQRKIRKIAMEKIIGNQRDNKCHREEMCEVVETAPPQRVFRPHKFPNARSLLLDFPQACQDSPLRL